MNVWETSGQEPLSGINLDDCERIDVTKDGVRLVLSTGDADPGDRPQGFMEEHCKNLHRASSVEADSSNRPKNYPHYTFYLGLTFDPTGNT